MAKKNPPKRKSSVPKGHKIKRMPPGPVPESYLLGELVPTSGIGGHMMGVGPVTYYPPGARSKARRGAVKNPVNGWMLEAIDHVNETAALTKGALFLTVGLDPFVPGNYYSVVQDEGRTRQRELTHQAKSISDAVRRATEWANKEMKTNPRLNKGTPPKAKWMAKAITRPGKLGGKGFLSKPRDTQKKILRKCVDHYGYRSCLGSVMILERVPSVRAGHGRTLAMLRKFLVKDYGGEGSFGPQANPDKFTLVPEICGCEACQVKTNPEFRKALDNPSFWDTVKSRAASVKSRASSAYVALKGAEAAPVRAAAPIGPHRTLAESEVDFELLDGTSQKGKITASYGDLVKTFGKPTLALGPEDVGEKLTVEWWVQFPDGTLAFVSDFKGIVYAPDEWGKTAETLTKADIERYLKQNKKWDIGGVSKKSVDLIRASLRKAKGRSGVAKKKPAKKAKKRTKKNPSRAERAAIGGGAGALLLGPVGAIAGGYLGVKTAKKKAKKNPVARDILRKAMRGT